MLAFSPTSAGRRDAKTDGEKGLLTFVTVKYVKVRGAYEELATIWTADLDGHGRRRLAAGNGPDISPNGRWVAYRDNAGGLRVVSSTGGTPRLLARNTEYGGYRWGPDSRRLAADLGGGVSGVLAIIDVEGGGQVQIERGHILGFSLSPSGDQIVWARRTGKLEVTQGGFDLYVASTRGGTIRRLTRNRGSYKPLWGRSGIAFARFEPFTFLHPAVELWLVRPNGRALRRVSTDNLAPLAFSQGERKLLAYAESEVGAPPYAVEPSSGEARALIRLGGAEVSANAISRDGRWVLAVKDDKLVRVPWAGGPPHILARGVDEAADWTR